MTDASAPEMEWDELAPGGEISATVMMMSGFVLSEGQRVRERYHIENVIGAGAMGQVLAVKLVGSSDKTTFALKVVARPVDANDDGVIDAEEHAEATRAATWFAELLRAEAAKQDQVQRHGVAVARLFALVQLDDGSIGMRMELARGRSLESWLESQKGVEGDPPQTMWALQVVRKLVSQLRRLHEMADTGSPFGFVHSDIKPGNVFVEDSDTTDIQITLLDFGVATAGQALAHDMSTRGGGRQTFVLQQTGGTIGYAPPLHFSSKATPLSDVYASLVILYELITLQFPWNYGEMALTAENLVMLETAMLRGPRPVRDIRPSIPHEDARALDEFFSREFVLLNDLAEQVHAVMVVGNDADAQRKLVERLAVVSRDYQVKLDQLRMRLSPSRRPNANELLSLGNEDAEEKPTPLAIPKAPRTPRIALDGVDGGDDVSTSSSEPRARKPSKPTLMVLPSMIPPPNPAMTAASATSVDPDDAEPAWRRRLPWIIAGVGIPLVAAITILLLRSSSSSGPAHTPPTPQPAPSRPVSSFVPPVPAAAIPTVEPVHLPTPVAPSLPAHSSVSLADVRSAPEIAAPTTGASPRASARGSQPCTCVAPVSGARVVARGGTLRRDVTVCTADRPSPDGRAEFYGTGAIPASVFHALPQMACDGGAPMVVTVQRYASIHGSASLFRCRAAAPSPRESAQPAAEPAPAAESTPQPDRDAS